MFTENQKLEELLEANPQLILMLPRFNMDLGFGEKKVTEVCKERNIPCSMFLTICNVYTYDHYMPTKEDLNSIDGEILVNYLRSSHDYYLNHRLNHIGKHVEKIADAAGGKIGPALMKFFSDYKEEVAKHFNNEESTLFPQIYNQENCTKEYDIKEISDSHTAIFDKLSDMTNIIVKYLPPSLMTNERIGVWFDLTQLTRDLDKHTKIEEKILVPFVRKAKGGD